MLHPGEFVLGSTLERIAVPDDLVARIEGKSSLGRLGLLIHSTAGFIDAGFDGHVTLELANVASLPITLYPGMKIGQVSFMQMTTPADKPYGQGATGSKYQGQRGPTPSRYFENFRTDARSDCAASDGRDVRRASRAARGVGAVGGVASTSVGGDHQVHGLGAAALDAARSASRPPARRAARGPGRPW